MNIIVAVDNKWGIGRDNGLLASIPGDMKFFRETTTGKVVVMGRKTLESMPGKRGLPNRTNYVLTRDENYVADRAIVVNSEEKLFSELKKYESDDVYVIGGASLYNRLCGMCDRLLVTKMDADLNADTFIINFDEDDRFELVAESEPVTENGITYRFTEYRNNSIR